MRQLKRRKGARPLSIKIFALTFLGAAVFVLGSSLQNIGLLQGAYRALFPWDGWNRDWMIVAVSAIFSIALIPVAWIYLFGSRVARWLVTIFSLLKLANVPNMIFALQATGEAVHWRYFAEPALLAVALTALFMPSSRRWLARKEADPAVFE
jgi:hypothetical protein